MALEDAKRTEIEKAARYYFVFLAAQPTQPDFQRLSVVYQRVLNAQFAGLKADTPMGRIHVAFARIAVQMFLRKGWLQLIEDDFAEPHVKLSLPTEELASRDEQYAELSRKLEQLGNSRNSFLASALGRIATSFDDKDLTAYLDAMSPRALSDPKTQASPTALDDAPWEPLAIDRDNPAYKEAVAASEAALREIEGSNGYATTEPEERNAIVAL
jgi:hypothetical protein